MFLWCSELLRDNDLTREVMETQEQEKLMALHQKITLSAEFAQQWFEGLRRILHESNSAKVQNV